MYILHSSALLPYSMQIGLTPDFTILIRIPESWSGIMEIYADDNLLCVFALNHASNNFPPIRFGTKFEHSINVRSCAHISTNGHAPLLNS